MPGCFAQWTCFAEVFLAATWRGGPVPTGQPLTWGMEATAVRVGLEGGGAPLAQLQKWVPMSFALG